MMILPNPGVLDELIRDRQKGLRRAARGSEPAGKAIRMRIGRALIAAGTALGGERVEPPARSRALPRTA